MDKFKLVFWEPTVSPHKIGLVKQLLRSERIVEVKYVAQRGLSSERIDLGWTADFGTSGVELIISPSAEDVSEILDGAGERAIHIFSGVRWNAPIASGLRACIKYCRRFGILSEPRNDEGIRGLGRFFHSVLTEAEIRRNVRFVLAIGRNGPTWFQKTGYAWGKIFPFAYFPSNSQILPNSRDGFEKSVGFVGRMNSAKGFDIFADALERVPSGIQVVLAGNGPLKGNLLRGYPARTVVDRGVVPIDQISSVMSEIDVLVVPSITKNDGWAMVISEALLSGCAVVATEKVGGSVCLDHHPNGVSIANATPEAVSDAIVRLFDAGIERTEFRFQRAKWAHEHLTAVAGANYLIEILEHCFADGPKPDPFFNRAYGLTY